MQVAADTPRTRSPEALLALAPSAAYSPGAEETRPRPSQRPEAPPGSKRRGDTPLPPRRQGKALHRRVSGEGRGGLGAVSGGPSATAVLHFKDHTPERV